MVQFTCDGRKCNSSQIKGKGEGKGREGEEVEQKKGVKMDKIRRKMRGARIAEAGKPNQEPEQKRYLAG